MVESVYEIECSRRCRNRPENRLGRPTRRGFSFVEILFAVMILGIGFILIAGIFPVAINQTQANGDETIAATTARQGAAVIANLPNTALLMVADSNVHRFGPSGITASISSIGTTGDPDLMLWNEINGSQVLSEDPRYAWIPFYCRRKDANGLPANFAQIIIIAARVRNHDVYIPSTSAGGDFALNGTGANALATLIGTPIDGVTLNWNNSLATPDLITFPAGTGAVAPGTFIIIAFDKQGATNAATRPTTTDTAVGWVLKVGAPATAANTYLLQPGGDIKNQTIYRPPVGNPPVGDTFRVFIVGQGADPSAAGTFSGGAQDVMAYTTFIPLH